MFDNLAKKFISIVKNISGYGRITEKQLHQTLLQVKKNLLEADVSYIVIKEIITQIKKKVIGKDINQNLTPGQEFIKILKQELISIMHHKETEIKIHEKNPNIFLIVGLQGSGKTTSVGKLGYFIKKKYKKKVLVASTDIYRPAAIEQLFMISKQSNINFFNTNTFHDPIEISKRFMKEIKKSSYDVFILDTAGRMHINQNMMQQIKKIKKIIQPTETLFIIDAMMGQDAIHVAKKFHDDLSLTGLILTKTDSDTKGGSALSASYITKKPIKFIGTGEKISSLSIFNPERIVSRILGMGDIFSIIEVINKKEKNKNKKNNVEKKFDLEEFKQQMSNIENYGGIKKIISNLPINIFNNSQKKNITEKRILLKFISIINSMTPLEKKNPNIIKMSRKKRIAKGSGTTVQDVNQLLKNFYETKKIIKKIKYHGIEKTLQNIKKIIPKIF
ncbi:signal recognition particle protein [Buchnera aphidicola]|uniref:signal recognition particle protein n=1 Tax=Buchnera aphidicola TaxID=9 RepID=UPI0031B80723